MIEEKKEVVLNEKLQKVLDSLGDNPIKEPEIAKVLDEKPLKKSKAIKLSFKKSKLKLDTFTALELANYFKAMVDKITSTRLPDDTFKSTKATTNFQLPNFEQVEDISELIFKLHKLRKEQGEIQEDVVDGKPIDTKKLKKSIKELEKTLVALDNITWEVSGLSKDDLTVWEQTLVSEQIYASVSDVEKTSLGKQ